MTICKSDPFDKIKQEFFQNVTKLYHLNFNETTGELHKKAVCCFEQILEVTPHKTATVRPLTSHHTNNLCKTDKTCYTLLMKGETQK